MSSRIGLVSDTHGLLRPSAVRALQGVDHIIHAGDIGREDLIPELEAIAPVTAVRGNVDRGAWASRFPVYDVFQLGETYLYVRHILEELDLDPVAAGFAAVITGHTHRPHQETRNGVLYVNPGSIGPRRFHLPISLAVLRLDGDGLEVESLELTE